MKKLVLLFTGLYVLVSNGFTADKYAQSAITSWITGPWYDAATGGATTTAPVAGDNVFTNGFAVTVDADATCDNLTLLVAVSGSSVSNQLKVSAGATLTVRGKIDGTNAPATSTSHTLYDPTGTGTIKLTGETLSSPYTLIGNNVIGLGTNPSGMFKPVNLVIDPVNKDNTYQFGTSNVNYVHGAGTFTIRANTKLDIKTVCQLGTGVGNELIIEEGAVVTTTNHFKGGAGNNSRITKVTVNGSITCGDFSQLIANTLILGNNATLKTSNSNQTNAAVLSWDGWWGAKTLTNPTPVVSDFGTPATITMGTNTTIEFGKSGDQNINGIVPANGTSPSTAYSIPYVNLKISGSGNKTIQSDLTVTGTLDIVSGTTLTIVAGKKLTLAPTARVNNAGTITNNGTIDFLSNATDGTATIIGNGVITGSGTINMSQYLTTGRNWYITNPMNTAVSPSVASGTLTLNAYDETTVTNDAGTWEVTTNPLAVGKGYVATVTANGNITFSGAFNDGNQNIALTSRLGTADKAGFNLIGNPYPSYLDWNVVSAANSGVMRSTTMWYRTKNGSNPYSFWTVNGDGVGVPNGASVKIPPMQSFWVRAVEGGSTLSLSNAMRSHAPASDKLLKAPARTERTLIRLQVSNGINADEAVIYFNTNAQDGLDILDAPKMSNDNVDIPEIYTTLGSDKIVINSMNSIPIDVPIGLGFVPGNASTFSITAKEITNMPEGVKVILRDNVTSTETDLTDKTATYSFAPEITYSDRFSVIFRTTDKTTDITAAQRPQTQVLVNANNRIIITAPEKASYKIYNTVGQLIESGQITTKLQTVISKLQTGVYIVKVNNQTTKVIVK